jgi:hypothetical protein
MTIFFLVLGVMGLVMAAMAVGVVLKRPCLRGSCGGPEMTGLDGESLSCAACPNRQRAETRAL